MAETEPQWRIDTRERYYNNLLGARSPEAFQGGTLLAELTETYGAEFVLRAMGEAEGLPSPPEPTNDHLAVFALGLFFTGLARTRGTIE